jgi:hypothetical protein
MITMANGKNLKSRIKPFEGFIKEHGCYECEGYKNAKCGGRA